MQTIQVMHCCPSDIAIGDGLQRLSSAHFTISARRPRTSSVASHADRVTTCRHRRSRNTVFAKYGVACCGTVGNAGPLGFNDNAGNTVFPAARADYLGASNKYIGLFNGNIVASGSYNDLRHQRRAIPSSAKVITNSRAA